MSSSDPAWLAIQPSRRPTQTCLAESHCHFHLGGKAHKDRLAFIRPPDAESLGLTKGRADEGLAESPAFKVSKHNEKRELRLRALRPDVRKCPPSRALRRNRPTSWATCVRKAE